MFSFFVFIFEQFGILVFLIMVFETKQLIELCCATLLGQISDCRIVSPLVLLEVRTKSRAWTWHIKFKIRDNWAECWMLKRVYHPECLRRLRYLKISWCLPKSSCISVDLVLRALASALWTGRLRTKKVCFRGKFPKHNKCSVVHCFARQSGDGSFCKWTNFRYFCQGGVKTRLSRLGFECAA